MEAVCLGTRACVEALSMAGHECKEIVIAGGATRSALWLQMHADVTGLPVIVCENTDAPLVGCAILGSVGAGVHETVADAVKAMVREAKRIEPDPEACKAYTELFNRVYRQLSPSVRPIVHAIADLRGGASKNARSLPFLTRGKRDAAFNYSLRGGDLANDENVCEMVDDRSQVCRRHQPIISPSLLSCDWADMRGEVRRCEVAQVPWLHVDVFDGVYLDSPYALTFGPQMIKAIRQSSSSNVTLDIHICVDRPERYIEAISAAGGDRFIFQFEAMSGEDNNDKIVAATELARAVNQSGMKCGVSINPSTDVSLIYPLLETGLVGLVDLLAVEPGFGGQKFQHKVLEKLRRLRLRVDQSGWDVLLMVDGGINADTAKQVVEAGADILVAGSFLFQHREGFEFGLKELRKRLR